SAHFRLGGLTEFVRQHLSRDRIDAAQGNGTCGAAAAGNVVVALYFGHERLLVREGSNYPPMIGAAVLFQGLAMTRHIRALEFHPRLCLTNAREYRCAAAHRIHPERFRRYRPAGL